MIYYSNDCVDCGLPCIFESCKYYNAKHFKCDRCGEEDIKLYHYYDEELCEHCLLKEFKIVEGSDIWF